MHIERERHIERETHRERERETHREDDDSTCSQFSHIEREESISFP